MEVFSPFDNMTEEEKIRFVYVDLESRNLADEETIQKDLENDLALLKEKSKHSKKEEKADKNRVA